MVGLNIILQTVINPTADKYPKVGNPKIPGMKAFHTTIRNKGSARRIATAAIRRTDFFIGFLRDVIY